MPHADGDSLRLIHAMIMADSNALILPSSSKKNKRGASQSYASAKKTVSSPTLQSAADGNDRPESLNAWKYACVFSHAVSTSSGSLMPHVACSSVSLQAKRQRRVRVERRRDRESDEDDESDGEDWLRHEKDNENIVENRKVIVPDDEDYTGLAGAQGEKGKNRRQNSKRLSRKLRRIQVGASRMNDVTPPPSSPWGFGFSRFHAGVIKALQ